MAYIYKHIRLDKKEIFYIGIADDKNNNEELLEKKYQRAYKKSGRSNWWKNIANNGYLVEIITDDIDWSNAVYGEKYLIKYYGRKDLKLGPLVNLTDGGEGNANLSPEIRKQKGLKISQKKKGIPNIKGRVPKSEETKQKLREANLGKKYSEETNKKKANNDQFGEKNHMFGKMYINNGIENKTIKKEDPIPQGFIKGRLTNWIIK